VGNSHLPRLERRRLGWGDLAAEQRQLLLERVGKDGAETRGLGDYSWYLWFPKTPSDFKINEMR